VLLESYVIKVKTPSQILCVWVFLAELLTAHWPAGAFGLRMWASFKRIGHMIEAHGYRLL